MNLFVWFWDNVTKPQDEKRIKTLRVPTMAERVDIAYVNDGDKYHMLDVYSPLNCEGPLPTIIDVHGGGWYYGDKELNKIYCLNLVERGFKVVNISYRLTPKASLKDQVIDVATAINYIYDNASELGIDLNNLFLTGDSAGGHLASLMVNLSVDEDMQNAFGINLKTFFNAVCYTCPALYTSKLATMPIVKTYFYPLLGKKAKENDIFPYIDFRADKCEKVPSLFITCDGDFMKGQTLKGYEEYKNTGAECQLVHFAKDDQTNKLTHVYNVIQPDWEESVKANDITAEFFRKYIR